MNNEGLIGWMSGGEVAIIASSIQWRVKSAFITYRCPLCQQMLSRIRSHHVCLIATDSSWCTYLTNSLTAKQARTMAMPFTAVTLLHPRSSNNVTSSHSALLLFISLLAREEVARLMSGVKVSKVRFCAKMMFGDGS